MKSYLMFGLKVIAVMAAFNLVAGLLAKFTGINVKGYVENPGGALGLS